MFGFFKIVKIGFWKLDRCGRSVRLVVGTDGRTSLTRAALGLRERTHDAARRLAGVLLDGVALPECQAFIAMNSKRSLIGYLLPQAGGRARVYAAFRADAQAPMQDAARSGSLDRCQRGGGGPGRGVRGRHRKRAPRDVRWHGALGRPSRSRRRRPDWGRGGTPGGDPARLNRATSSGAVTAWTPPGLFAARLPRRNVGPTTKPGGGLPPNQSICSRFSK